MLRVAMIMCIITAIIAYGREKFTVGIYSILHIIYVFICVQKLIIPVDHIP